MDDMLYVHMWTHMLACMWAVLFSKKW